MDAAGESCRYQAGLLGRRKVTHLLHGLFEIGKLRRLHSHGLDGAVAQADADDHTAGRIFFQRCIGAGQNRRMARERIGDTGANLDLGSIQGDGGHIDVGLAPDEVRVTNPHVAKAEFLRKPGEMNYLL